MSKKRWRRVRLADLASAEEQARVLGVMDQAQGRPEADDPEKRASQSPKVQ